MFGMIICVYDLSQIILPLPGLLATTPSLPAMNQNCLSTNISQIRSSRFLRLSRLPTTYRMNATEEPLTFQNIPEYA